MNDTLRMQVLNALLFISCCQQMTSITRVNCLDAYQNGFDCFDAVGFCEFCIMRSTSEEKMSVRGSENWIALGFRQREPMRYQRKATHFHVPISAQRVHHRLQAGRQGSILFCFRTWETEGGYHLLAKTVRSQACLTNPESDTLVR